MSKVLSVATVIEANRLSSDVPFLALIDVDVVNPDTGGVVQSLHIVRNPESVTFQGQLYEPGQFDITIKNEAGRSSEVSLNVVDYTQAIMSMLEAYKGGVGSKVRLYIVPADGMDRPAEAQEDFQVVAVSAANFSISFTLGAENALAQVFPIRRETRDFCQWRYKDPKTCGYSGPMASCDYSLKGSNGCAAHNNSANFGGFPGINSNGQRYA